MGFLMYHWIMARKQHLVTGHLEGIGAEVFVQFPEVITAMVAGHHGIYALYNGERLYYVGLATDLKNRLKAHLRDRHKKLWDRFSVYITSTDEHIKELESLMLRVIQPEGNRVKGKLKGSDALNRDLDRRIKDVQDQRRSGILGRIARAPKTGERKTRGASTALIAFYKGFTYKATLRADGQVRYAGTLYESLSAAAKAVTNRRTSGPGFWYVQNPEGEWVRYKENEDRPTDRRSATNGRTPLKAFYKGKTYTATLRADGQVRWNGELYNSLSAAGRALTGRGTNGRHFWRMQDAHGDWVRLSDLNA